MMDFAKVEDFLRLNFPAIVIVTVTIAPTVWGLASLHYNERMDVLSVKVTDLNKEVLALKEKLVVLDQAAARKLVAAKESFTAEELFTPSLEVKTENIQ